MITIELILGEFKKQVDAGNKLDEIIPINKNNMQVRTEYNDFIIQLFCGMVDNNEVKLISYKQKKDLDWTRCNVDTFQSDKKEQIKNKFNEIKNKLLKKKNIELMKNKNKNERTIELIKGDGSKIKKKYDKNITKLNLSYNNISGIKGLDRFLNLKELWLYDNSIEDIKSIENLDKLINLEKLCLSSNGIKNIEGVDKLINLTYLGLSCNKLINVDCINNLVKLKSLDLINNKINSMPNINRLIDLEWLGLINNPININLWANIVYYGNSHLEINCIFRHIDKWKKDYKSIFKEHRHVDDDEKYVKYTDKEINKYKKYIFKKNKKVIIYERF
jgi:hypothetical protein